MHLRLSGIPPRSKGPSPLSTWKVLFRVMVKTQLFRGVLGGLFSGIEGESGLGEEGAGPVSDRGLPGAFLISCRSLSGAPCRLSRAESERRCRAPGQPPGGALCHGRGRCECGVCICQVTEPGTYFGPLCECHEWVCETYDGKTCAGKAQALSPFWGHLPPDRHWVKLLQSEKAMLLCSFGIIYYNISPPLWSSLKWNL